MSIKTQCWIFAAVLLLCAAFAHSQAVAPFQGLGNVQFFDNNGQPLTSGVLYTYLGGTSSPQATYTDSTGLTQNPNPLPFSSGARASIWLTPTINYKFVLCLQNDGSFCAPGDVLYSEDQVPGSFSGSGGGSPFTGTFISGSTNPATTGILRLASGDSICWRNVAGSGNLCFAKDLSDVLSWGGGAIKFPAVTCVNTATGFDYLCADSSTNHFAEFLNGGTKLVLAGIRNSGVPGHTTSLDSNGIDLLDSGGTAPASATVSYSATPAFAPTAQDQLFFITLTGNVTSSTLTVPATLPVPSVFTFEITQDATGGRTFVWPANVIEPPAIRTDPNSTTRAAFVWNGLHAGYLGPVPCTTITKAAAYTLTGADCVVQANAVGSFTLSLSHAVTGTFWEITRTDNNNNVLTIAGDAGQINGVSAIHLGNHMTIVCHADGVNSWCTNPGEEFSQSAVVNGCAASSTCTFTYPLPFSTLNACVCSGEGGSCNINSKSTTACTINTSGATPYDFVVTGIP
jgi:hypothetical protein